jgi:hypothetical protein
MLLGRPIGDEGNKLLGYQAIGESDINDFRMLAKRSSIDATNFLLYRLGGKEGLANASSYIGKVVKGDMNHQKWMEHFYRATQN